MPTDLFNLSFLYLASEVKVSIWNTRAARCRLMQKVRLPLARIRLKLFNCRNEVDSNITQTQLMLAAWDIIRSVLILYVSNLQVKWSNHCYSRCMNE